MDEMRIKVKNGFLKGSLEKLFAWVILKKLKFPVAVAIHEAELTNMNTKGKVSIHANVTLEFDERQLAKIQNLISMK